MHYNSLVNIKSINPAICWMCFRMQRGKMHGVFVCVSLYVSVSVLVCACVWVCVLVCVCACACACMRVCVCVWVLCERLFSRVKSTIMLTCGKIHRGLRSGLGYSVTADKTGIYFQCMTSPPLYLSCSIHLSLVDAPPCLCFFPQALHPLSLSPHTHTHTHTHTHWNSSHTHIQTVHYNMFIYGSFLLYIYLTYKSQSSVHSQPALYSLNNITVTFTQNKSNPIPKHDSGCLSHAAPPRGGSVEGMEPLALWMRLAHLSSQITAA